MQQDNNKKLSKEWFDIADNELGFARAGLEELNAFYPQVCFLCQQAVEKYLKGFLVYSDKKFHKNHDLPQLLKSCAETNKDFLEFLKGLDVLDQYYLISRYPLEYPPASRKEAEEALKIAKDIIEFIKIKIRY